MSNKSKATPQDTADDQLLDDALDDDQTQGTLDDDLDDDDDVGNAAPTRRRTGISKAHRELIEQLVEERLSDAKKNFKDKLDRAYKERDDRAREVARLEEAQKKATQATLKAEGKHFEALQLQVAEMAERLRLKDEALAITTRDAELDKALSEFEFRSPKARSALKRELQDEMIRDDDEGGIWVHNSGANVVDVVRAISKDPEQAFYFLPKTNQGTGTRPEGRATAPSKGRPKSLLNLPNEELMKLAAEGKLNPVPFG